MKNQKSQHDQETKARARYASQLADLLWRKACNNLPKETQELLNLSVRLDNLAAAVNPEDQEKIHYSFENIAKEIDQAEDLLIGCPPIALQKEEEAELVPA